MLYPQIRKTSADLAGYFTFKPFYQHIAYNFLLDGMTVLELGAFLGKSTAFLAERIKERGFINTTFYTVDHWLGSKEHLDPRSPYYVTELVNNPEYLWTKFNHNMRACGVSSFVKPIRATSEEAASKFENGTFDFIFIDASHDYENVCKDIDLWLPKLKPAKAIFAGDDYRPIWPGVIKAVDEKLPKRNLSFRPAWFVQV